MEEKQLLRSVAARHKLFSGLTEEEFSYALSFLDGRVSFYEKGRYLYVAGDPFTHFGLVLSGTVQVYSEDIDGLPLMMANVGVGETFGESLAFLGREESPVSVLAAEDTEVLLLRASPFRYQGNQPSPLALRLLERFTAVLAQRALSQNDRIQILSKPKIRERLTTFLSQCERQYGSRTFRIPFDRNSLAVYLGVNRSALSRELSLMKKEGIIDFFRSTFRLLP